MSAAAQSRAPSPLPTIAPQDAGRSAAAYPAAPAEAARLSPEALLSELNEQQRQAVTLPAGTALVLAGPGSGKTRVLTHRVAYLVGVEGVAPWRILAVTFTNKAAREMAERLEQLLGPAAARASIGTFHASCARLLRTEARDPALGLDFDDRFVIYDADDQRKVVKRIIAELDLDDKQYRARTVLGAISAAKNELLRPGDYEPPTYWHEIVGRVYARYQEVLRASNAVDFDDLLLEAADLLRRNETLGDKYRQRWRHVLIDEFQDTNTAQYELVRTVARKADDDVAPHSLFVVGDEDQSIYRWRGADWRNIQRFRRDFPEADVVLLEQNYRSTQNILDAARAVIDRNAGRTPKKLWTEAGKGSGITLFEALDEAEEAAYVIGRIERLVMHEHSYGDIAVMYRTNAQSRAIEDALMRRRIPYQLVGATRFYDRKEVRDAVAFLRLAHNPLDQVSLLRVINVPARGIGRVALDTLQSVADAMGVPLWSALQLIATDQEDAVLPIPPVDARTRNALAGFHDIVAELIAAREEAQPAELLQMALEQSGYADWLRDGTDEGEDRWSNLLELRGVASSFAPLEPREALAALLESVALVSDVDSMAATARVTLMTLHAAKGLEFPVVFITGLEELTLPHSRAKDDPEQLAEERRLFYVGITRARQRLFLVHAFRRSLFGASDTREPSRFLTDLPDHVLAPGRQPRGAAKAAETVWHSVAAPAANGGGQQSTFRAGDKVSHPKFGEGIVVSSTVKDDDEEVTVAFVAGGVKKLMQSFAKLQRG